MTRLLRAQHGPAISPASPELVAAVGRRLSSLTTAGESFTTPDMAETGEASAFAARARAFSPEGAKKARGAKWQMCHDIAAALARTDPARYRLVFGYALDSDPHWRTHSWVIDGKTGRIVEPTPLIRKAYVGVELSAAEAMDFYG